MSVIIQGSQLRNILLGYAPVLKSTGTLAATTISLYTVAGGEVMITSIYGKVTTAITVANSYKLQHNPTTGVTGDLCAATDIGTTDTPAGNLLSFQGLVGDSMLTGIGKIATLKQPLILTAGVIESVSAGTDGVIEWYVTWVPMTDGATLVAA
jgi:hypothetical protein